MLHIHVSVESCDHILLTFFLTCQKYFFNSYNIRAIFLFCAFLCKYVNTFVISVVFEACHNVDMNVRLFCKFCSTVIKNQQQIYSIYSVSYKKKIFFC